MSTAEILFWVSVSVLFYCYLGYGLLLYLWNGISSLFKRKINKQDEYIPEVTLIVAAFNEINVLEEKINNTLAIDYPAEKIRFIFITDGSTDGSQALIDSYPNIQLLHQKERKGKAAAINRAMQSVKTSIVVYSDANTMLNTASIKKIVQHYIDPTIGGVAGEKKIQSASSDSALGEAEGLYWKYESFMKKQDARLYSVVGAAGELFSIRTELFRPLPESIILDDFMISMNVCLQGYKIAYEPGAFAIESPSASLAEEEKRKVRISAGAYQAVNYLRDCLNIFKYPLISFQYLSRRLLRWIVCPLLLPILFLSNMALVNDPASPFYTWTFYLQIVFYLLAIPGWMLVRSGKKAGPLLIPFYFVFMNYCLVKGLTKFWKGQQTVLWEKSLRKLENVEL